MRTRNGCGQFLNLAFIFELCELHGGRPDRSLFGPKCSRQDDCVDKMVDEFRMCCTGIQFVVSFVLSAAPNDRECNVLKVDIFFAVGADQGLSEEWEAKDDVEGHWTREVKIVREKEIKHLWDMEVYVYSTGEEARALEEDVVSQPRMEGRFVQLGRRRRLRIDSVQGSCD